VYGMAECCLAVTFSAVGSPLRVEHVDRQALSRTGEALVSEASGGGTVPVFGVGHPVEGVDVSVRDPAGRQCPDGVLGTIWVKSEMFMERYQGGPNGAAAAGGPEWFDTGDLGYLREGTLFYFERVADCMRQRGTLFRPRDFEVFCSRIPEIKRGRSAVFAGTGADGHQEVHLLIETGTLYREKYVEIVESLNALHRAHLGTVPDHVYVVARGSILQTSSGKLRRGKCRERIADGSFDVHFQFDNRRGEVLYCK
jgi:acyl-CoA synthetase (AMP-forming)/AMP-acid ligase II